MADPPQDPFGLGDIGGDAPLFRELQRVLLSSGGRPVNWELARQVGIATASQAGEDPQPGDDDQRSFEDAVRLAELRVADLTRLEAPSDVARVEAVRRTRWVERTLDGLRDVLEPAAAKIGEAVARAQRDAMPEEALARFEGLSALLGQLSPLLLGAQVGTVVGTLGQDVLGQYDIAIPRAADAQAVVFVVPNVAAFERDWSLDPTEFRAWVAIHEVTHRFAFARPWVLPRFRELLEDYTSTLRLDVEGLQERLGALDPSDPEAMREAFAGEEGLFGPVLDDEQRLKLGRIQAFVAAAEGYGAHVTHALAATLLPSAARIGEAMLRYRESEETDPVLERLLGIPVERERAHEARRFCDTVVEQTDEATLARMWDDAASLPSLPEIDEPTLWLSRVA